MLHLNDFMSEEIKDEDVIKQFSRSMLKFGKQLEKLSTDLEAMEIITAIGTTTVKFKSEGQEGTGNNFDVTSLANSNDKVSSIIEGNITILARTRFELDGDLLVILPTKPKSTTPLGASTASTTGSTTGTGASTASTNPKDTYEIDSEVLELHKQNVNLALQNLQFVYGKAMELLTKLAEGNRSILGGFRLH